MALFHIASRNVKLIQAEPKASIKAFVFHERDSDFFLIDLIPERDCEAEIGASPALRFYPDAPAEALDHLPAEGQADATARVLRSIQAIKHSKDCLRKLWVNADPIVSYRKHPFLRAILRGGDVDPRRLLTSVFDRVSDQMQYLLGRIATGQRCIVVLSLLRYDSQGTCGVGLS